MLDSGSFLSPLRLPSQDSLIKLCSLFLGISNNSPTYAFLHPSRGTDVIINFDASSDVMSEAAPARNQEMGDMKGDFIFAAVSVSSLS